MNWLGFATFCTASIAGFSAGARACRSRRAGSTLRSGALLAVLVASVWLRYHPTLEARLFAPGVYAYLRPWWSVVLGLAFLGSALPQLPERRKRIAVGGLAAFLFLIVAERGAQAARTGPEDFSGAPREPWGTCKQTTGFSCGAAAAATLLAQTGIRATEAEMARRCLTNPFTGTDEIGVLKGLGEKLAGSAHTAGVARVAADELAGAPLPAMACTKLSLLIGHWVVILDCDGETVSVADPLYADNSATGGVRSIPLARFAEEYQGVLVWIRPVGEVREPGDME